MGKELGGPSSNWMLDLERGEKRNPSDGLTGFWLDHMSGAIQRQGTWAPRVDSDYCLHLAYLKVISQCSPRGNPFLNFSACS